MRPPKMQLFVYYGDRPIYPQGITHVLVHESINVIKERAFEHCQFIVLVIMHDSVDAIEKHAFVDCPRLKYLRVSKRLRSIGEYAFNCCIGLECLFLPDTLTNIGRKAFYFCESLDFLVLPMEADIRRHSAEDWDQTGLYRNVASRYVEYEYYNPLHYRRRRRHDYILEGEAPLLHANSRQLNRWFLTYMNDFPFHKICCDPSVSMTDVAAYLSSDNASDATVVDEFHRMTTLHILAMNPFTEPAPVAALFHYNKQAIFVLDRNDKSPIDLARDYNVANMLELINCLCQLREIERK